MFSIDFSNLRPFRYQTREFKQILLECLMKIAKNASSKIDFTFASVSIQELMNLFTNAPPSIIVGGRDSGQIEGENNKALLNIYVTKICAQEAQSTGYQK